MGVRAPVGSGGRTANRGAQEVLTHELRQRAAADMAMPRRRQHRFERGRLSRHFNRPDQGRGTVMRHFVPSHAVAALAFGVGGSPTIAGLIPPPGRAHRGRTGLLRTAARAIAVAAIAVTADQHRRAAGGTQVASSGRFHWQVGQWEARRKRPLRERLCGQRSWGFLGCGARHRG